MLPLLLLITMQYLAFHFTAEPLSANLALNDYWDLVVYHLGEIGFDSFEQEEDGLKAYILSDVYNEEQLKRVIEELPKEYILFFEQKVCEDKNWNEEWEKNYFQPLQIGNLGIRASFHAPMVGVKEELIIDPKMAFGTGNHATTASMIRLLNTLNLRGKSVIDMGCGSGILGIYAAKKGASRVYSIDFDEWSVRNTKENANLNNVELIVLHGDAAALSGLPKVDVFLANINRNVILADLGKYLCHTASHGVLLLSGFYDTDRVLIEEALHQKGWSITAVIEENSWLAVIARLRK